jgi:glycosyltransferase involved in cell wall biosynthesis
MKILHVINSVDPAGGGPIEGIKQIARCLQESSANQIHVASSDPPDADYVKDCPIPVFACGPGRFNYAFAPGLVKWLRRNHRNYDVVIVNGLWGYSGRAVHLALKGSSTPYVVFTHGMLDPWFKRTYPFKHLKKLLYWHFNEFRLLRNASAVLFTCEEERILARQSFRAYDAAEYVIAYGTSDVCGDRATQMAALGERFPELKNKRLVLFIGRIHPKKGVDLVIESFARIMAGDPDWHLVIAGPDHVGLKNSLITLAGERNVSQRITWTGMLQGDLKWGALHSAEVLLLPSHQENFGIVVAEALSCGVPTLISNKVNIWREVEQEGAGLVAEDTEEGACELLQTWLALSEEARRTMAANARRCFIRRFEIHQTTAALTSLFAGLEAGPLPRYVQG